MTIDAFVHADRRLGEYPGWHLHGKGPPSFGRPWFDLGPFPWPVSSREIGDRHIWAGGMMGEGDLYVSNALKRRLFKERVRYLWPLELEE